MINYTISTTDKELCEILDLQKRNLPQRLTNEEIQSQGFLTVSHTLEDLQKMNVYEHNIIMKDGNKVVGYLLAMSKKSRYDIPILIPMFETFDNVLYNGKFISQYNYIVVGQVCIDKMYRGRGLLDESYKAYKKHFKNKYEFAITEIATANQRSINAHKRIGFSHIHSYTDISNIEWSIVIWDWQNM